MLCSDQHAAAIVRALSIPPTILNTITALGELRGDRAGGKGAIPVPAKFKGLYRFTERQVDDYNSTLRRLRRLHRDALSELRQIEPSNLNNKRYTRAGAFLGMVATQMTSALQFLVEILSSGGDRSTMVVIFECSPICSNCTRPPDKPEDHPGVDVPPLDPAHYAELDYLLKFAHYIGERLWSGSLRRRKILPVRLITGLKRFTNALVKEQQHFRETAAARPTKIEWRNYKGPGCSVCHGPLTIPGPDGRKGRK